MYAPQPPRALSAASSVAIVGSVFALLLLGLNVQRTAGGALRLVSVELTRPQPAPNPVERPRNPHARKPAPEHEASPRNLRDQATPIVAPAIQPLIPPPPVIAAPRAETGAASNTGASAVPGPGRGAGGIGNGRGGGGTGGNGNGAGDGEPVVGPRQVGGKLSYRDLPQGVLGEGQEAAVAVLFAVEPNGKASHCRAERSSGHPALDALACRLIEQRFRFKPARDRLGRPVRSWVAETHTWIAKEK
jgi:protein TonB